MESEKNTTNPLAVGSAHPFDISNWRAEERPDEELLTLNWFTTVAVPLFVLGICLASRWAVLEVFRDPEGSGFAVVKGVAIVLFGFMYIGPIVALLLLKRKKPEEPVRPPSVPESAVECFISRKGFDGLGGSSGWLWVQEGWLCFHGEHFDFRLQRSDFVRSKPLTSQLRGAAPLSLLMPSGAPPFALVLRISWADKEFRQRFFEEIEIWERSLPMKDRSLYPPLGNHIARSRISVRVLLPWIANMTAIWLGATMVLGSIPAEAALAAQEARGIAGGICLILLVPVALVATAWLIDRAYDKRLRRAGLV